MPDRTVSLHASPPDPLAPLERALPGRKLVDTRVSGHTWVVQLTGWSYSSQAGCRLNRLIRASQLVAERRSMRIPRHGAFEIGNRLLEPRQVKQGKSRQVFGRHRFGFDLGGFRQRFKRLLELPAQIMSTGEIEQRAGRLGLLRNR